MEEASIVSGLNVESLLQSIRSSSKHDSSERAMACSLLSWYTGSCSVTERDDLRNSGAILVLLQAMERHRREEALQEDAIYALCNLVYSHADTRDKIQALGGIPVVIESMKRHPKAQGVQAAGCFALRHIAYHHPYNQRLCVQQGCIPLILAAMLGHSQSEKVQFAACIALLVLSELPETRSVLQKSWWNGWRMKRALRKAIENHPHKCGARAQTVLNRIFPEQQCDP